MRAMGWFTMLGAILGTVVGTMIGVYWVGFYFSPANAAQPALCPCTTNARGAVETLIRFQAGGAVAGLILLNIIGTMVRRSWARRAASRRPATVNAPPTV